MLHATGSGICRVAQPTAQKSRVCALQKLGLFFWSFTLPQSDIDNSLDKPKNRRAGNWDRPPMI